MICVILYRSTTKEGINMLLKINRTLRKLVLILGAICVVFKLADKQMTKQLEQYEEFQTEEFDDIW